MREQSQFLPCVRDRPRTRVARVNRCVHQLAGILGDDLTRTLRGLDHLVIFADVCKAEWSLFPPFTPIAERRSQRIARRLAVRVAPPVGAICETHGMESGDKLSAFIQRVNLASDTPGTAPVVVVPVDDDVAGSHRAAEVTLLADVAALGKVDKSDPFIVWQ